MTYQELQNILQTRQMSPVGYAPSLDEIITGIQSQYQPNTQQSVGYDNVASMGQGASRFVPDIYFASQEVPFIEYGRQVKPSFTRGEFNIDSYRNPSIGDVIDAIGGSGSMGGDSAGGFGSNSSPATSISTSASNSGTGVTGGVGANTGIGGFSIGPNGFATSNSVNQGLATIGGLVTGMPLGLAAALNNMAANSAAQGFNAAIGDTMGLNANNTSQAAISANAAANGMAGVTGGAASDVGAAAAAAAAASGHSDAAIGAAAQAAADAAIGGASPSAAAAAAADAANAAAADAADADGSGIGTAATGGIGGVGIGESGGGGSGGGSKIICTKLHELGLMQKSIYEADQAFGKKLVNDSPETYEGYVRWAKHVVNLMSRNDLIGKATVFCVYHIATPWSLAMAEEMGQPVKASWFGKFLMKRGLQLCKLIGSGNKQTVMA